jgi:uncharacterized membrane protein YccC
MTTGGPGANQAAETAAWVGRAFRQAAVVNRARISVRAGAVAAVPVAGMLALGTVIGTPSEAVTMGVGAMLSGVAWRAGDGPETPPLGTMIGATFAIALATVAGTLTGRWPWLHLAVLIPFCLAAGWATALGRRGVVPGTHALIAYAVFGRFPENAPHAFGLAGLVIAGGAAQILFASLVALPAAWRRQRAALAAAYQTLAAQTAAVLGGSAPVASALESAERVLTAPALFADPAASTLAALVDEGRRIRLELIVFGTVARQVQRDGMDGPGLHAELDLALGRVHDALELVVSAAVDAHVTPEQVGDAAESFGAWGASRVALDDATDNEVLTRLDTRLAAVIGQVTAALRLAVGIAGHRGQRRVGRPQAGTQSTLALFRADLRKIRENITLDSASGRHALRLTVVVAGTELLVQRTSLPRGYWAVVAAATVLRPGFGATFTRGAERVAGTVLGAVAATLIAVALNPSGWGIVAVLGLLAFFTYTVFSASFTLGTVGMTGVVVFLLHAVSPDSATTALDRGIDTLIGGSIGLLAYALWPTWSANSTDRVLATLLDAQHAYLRAVLDALVTGSHEDTERLRPLARRARIAWTDAESAVKLARSEPRHGEHDPRAAAATLSALRRVVYGVHALRLEASGDAGEELPAMPELQPLADALVGSLAMIAAGLRDELPALAQLPPLRLLYRELPELPDGIRATLDELIDATDTVAASIGFALP